MINGEATQDEVASPDRLDSTSPKSDGGDDASQYSSCGESEFERYCSANSVMGTPSLCSSIGTFNDCVDSEFGSLNVSNFDNFSLGGSRKLPSSGGLQLYDSEEGGHGASGSEMMIEGRVELGGNVDNVLSRGIVNSEENETQVEGEGEGGSSRYEHSEGEDSMYGYGTDDERGNDLYFKRGVQYGQEVKGRNENEYPFLINSSVAFGSDDWDDFEQETGGGMLASMSLENIEEHEDWNPSSATFIGIPSVGQMEQGKDATDVFVAREQVQDADESEDDSNNCSVNPIGASGAGEPEQVKEVRDITLASYQVQGADELVEDTEISSITAISFPKSHETGKDVRDNSVTGHQVQGADELIAVTRISSITAISFPKSCEPQRDVRDDSVTSHQVQGAENAMKNLYSCSVDDVFEMEKDPRVANALEIGLNIKDCGMEREHQFVNNKEVIRIDENQVLENQEFGNSKAPLDPLSDIKMSQLSSYSVEPPEKLNAESFDDCKPSSPQSKCENATWGTLNDTPASADLFEDNSLLVKGQNLELNYFYDEVVHEMEEILLDSAESPGFPQGNRMFQSQLSLPLRDGGSTASTSGTDDANPLVSHPLRIDGVEVVGAKQKKGNVSLSERLVGVKEYTVYRIRVRSGKDQWEVERRYRDFFTLYRRLKSLYADQGWILPSPWSSVEKESRKIFGNASPDVVSERSVLIQQCLHSILQSRFYSSPPSALIWFLSPQDSYPSSPASNALVTGSTYFTRVADTENISTLGKTVSLIVEIRPYKSMKQMLEAQHYTCAGCHKHFDDGMTLMRDFVQTFGWGKPRLCEYIGQLFCSSCHTNETAVLPARVLHHWDFTQYPVSQLAKSYLDSIHDQPMLCVSAVNPFLFSKVPALQHVMGIRKKIGTMLPYVRCPFRRSINKGLGSRRYLLESNDFFALRDLIDLSKGAFAALPVMVETVSRKILEHITEQCLVCCDVGVPCSARQACNDPSYLIFPFQEGEVERCTSCDSVFHKRCFGKITNCPCGAHLRVDEAVGSTKRVSRSASGEASGPLNLLGRRSDSGLSVGLLSGLFSKAKPEKLKEHKDSDTVILMGSLPSTSF